MAFYDYTNQSGTMMIFEEWENWPSLEKHIQSDSYRNMLELLELSFEQPEIKFYSVSYTKSMEVIERLIG